MCLFGIKKDGGCATIKENGLDVKVVFVNVNPEQGSVIVLSLFLL